MRIYIELKDVVAGAFIRLLSETNKREISYRELDDYGASVVNVLNEDKSVSAILVMSKNMQIELLEDYSDYFEEYDSGNSAGLKLRNGVNKEVLCEKFCMSMSLRVLAAFKKAKVA